MWVFAYMFRTQYRIVEKAATEHTRGGDSGKP